MAAIVGSFKASPEREKDQVLLHLYIYIGSLSDHIPHCERIALQMEGFVVRREDALI